MTMRISPDFKEFVACANRHDVRFLIVGGYAVAFHGHPRYTKDLDVWIERTPDNVRRLIDALKDFGFHSLDLEPDDFLEPEQVIQLGRPPLRIDLLTSVSGLEFEDCYPDKNLVDIDKTTLPFIALEDLKKNKRATGRHQDLADIENLE